MKNEKCKENRRSPVKFSVVIFLIFILAILKSPDLFGARVAGEEGVSSTTPQERAVGQDRPKTVAPRKPATPKVRPRPLKKDVVKKKAVSGEKIGDRFVNIDFDNVDIALFIKFISELTGKNFVIDNKVRGKVTIISPKKISVNEAYRVFESVLEVHGFTTVPSGKVIKIVPLHDARSKSIETRLKEERSTPEDKVVTQLIPLAYANPDELKKLFAPLVSKNSLIISYPPTRTLIVTDVLSNMQRISKIVKAIDVVGVGEEITVIPVKHADVSNLAKSLNTVFTAGRVKAKKVRGGVSLKIVPDERTNVLIILATEDDTLKIKQLIELLDKETPPGERDIHVYYLQNANAEDLAKVLTALPAKQAKAPGKGKAPVISKEVQIVPDKATNTLVITAGKDDYLVLEDVIKKLDIPRPMVYIEALIMEVKVDKAFELGVEWMGIEDFTYNGRTGGAFGAVGGGGYYGDIAKMSGLMGVPPGGLSLGVVGEAIKIGELEFPNLGAILRAYETDSDVHILSTPQILTLDNEEAEIKVGENVPYLTTTGTTTGGRDYESYEYKDVGITLKITPQINRERLVRLAIFQEITKVTEGVEEGRPRTLKRSAQTTVTVKDKNTVVIGGLIGEDITKVNYKVPCLGDIPGLGWLFKSVSRSRDKTNLFVFLTPHIIENPGEAKAIYEQKKEQIDKIEEGVIKMYKNPEFGGQNSEVRGVKGD